MTGWGQAAGWFLPPISMPLKAVLNCSSFGGVYQHQKMTFVCLCFFFPLFYSGFPNDWISVVNGSDVQQGSQGGPEEEPTSSWVGIHLTELSGGRGGGGRRSPLNGAQPRSFPFPPVMFNHQ